MMKPASIFSLHRGFVIRAASPRSIPPHPTPGTRGRPARIYRDRTISRSLSGVCPRSSAKCRGPQHPSSKCNRCSGSWPFCGLSYLSIRASLKHFPQLSVHKKETEINFDLMSAVSWVTMITILYALDYLILTTALPSTMVSTLLLALSQQSSGVGMTFISHLTSPRL